MPILLDGHYTVSTGIEPAISCVTGRRVNRYTTRPKINGDSYGTRTRVTAVKGRCLNRLTKGPLIENYLSIYRNIKNVNAISLLFLIKNLNF